VGIHEAAHATALGKNILASLDARQRTDYLRTHPLHRLTRRTVTDERCLLERIDQSGAIARDDGEYLPGVSCLAVPIRTTVHLGAIGVARSESSRSTASDDEALAILQAGAGRISRSLQLAAAL
jgi:DNA-binding IclR family transcriptional regulator